MNPRPLHRAHSAAYDRFLASMQLSYDQWHDGEGYDLAALRELEPWEVPELVRLLRERSMAWREVEALAALSGAAEAELALTEATRDPHSVDVRLAAAEALNRQGRLDRPLAEVVADEIRNLATISDGLVRALRLAEQHPTEGVRRALLRASRHRTECAMHCAALLCFLCGVAKEPFDWELRPLFLQLNPGVSEVEREAAFAELCRVVGMEREAGTE